MTQISPAPTVFLSSVFDPGLHEPLRAALPGRIWDPRVIPREFDRTIEDVCRDLIRKSQLFVGVFDERGGNAPFEEGVGQITVLEVELLQALFQRLPVHLFLLPGFGRNRRLDGLVRMALANRLALLHPFPETAIDVRDEHHKALKPLGVDVITRVIRDPWRQRMSQSAETARGRIAARQRLDVTLLDCDVERIRDPFSRTEVTRYLEKAMAKSDHAARLTFLWPVLRQLASTPYYDPRFFEYRDLWQQLAGAWDTSAAWYGLHNCSPISKLAAANTLAWLADNDPSTSTTTFSAGGARGPRASALYSLAKRSWLPWQRARLFRLAKDDIKAVLAASPHESSNVIAVRGSANLQLWRLRQAVADYEAVVAMRTRLGASLSAQGEAWTELGWGYFWQLRLSKSLAALRKGVAMMRSDFERDPTVRVDFYIRGLMKHAIVSLLTLNLHEGTETLATACKLAQKRIANDQVRGFRRLLCRVLDTARSTGRSGVSR